MRILTLASLPLLLAGWGCVHRDQIPAASPAPTGCQRNLLEISSASHSEAAIEATSGYLSCIATWPTTPPPNLEGRVADALADNPYPQTRREAPEILAHFFDEGRLRDLPRKRRQLEPYRAMLDAQILRARAEGDAQFVAAAEKRAKDLQVLSQVLDSMSESD